MSVLNAVATGQSTQIVFAAISIVAWPCNFFSFHYYREQEKRAKVWIMPFLIIYGNHMEHPIRLDEIFTASDLSTKNRIV